MTIIPAPEGPHRCPLPRRHRYDTGHRVGTLYQCAACARWWQVVPGMNPSNQHVHVVGPFTEWQRVRWWHRAARRRIAEQAPPRRQGWTAPPAGGYQAIRRGPAPADPPPPPPLVPPFAS